MRQEQQIPLLQDSETLTPSQLRALHSLFRLYASRGIGAGVLPDAVASATSGPEGAGETGLPIHQTGAVIVSATPSPAHDIQAQRLALASTIVGREVSGLSGLRMSEASTLIDALKRALGQKVNPPRARRRPDRDQARAYGTAGRRANTSNEIQLVDDATRELLDDLLAQLGWTQQRLDSFLRSRMSPVRSGAIRTLAEANRVIWALKNMIRRRDQPGAALQHSSLSLFTEEKEANNERR